MLHIFLWICVCRICLIPCVFLGCLDPDKFKDFKLVKRTQLSHNVAKFKFALPTPSAVLGLPIGQHMSCRFGSFLWSKSIFFSFEQVMLSFNMFDMSIILVCLTFAIMIVSCNSLVFHTEEKTALMKTSSNHIPQQLWIQMLDTLN